MPMTAAERQKKYIEKLKRDEPEKYEEKRQKHLQKVKDRQKEKKLQTGNKKPPKTAKQDKEQDINTTEEILKINTQLRKRNNILENKILLLNRKIKALQKTLNRCKFKINNLMSKIEPNNDLTSEMNDQQEHGNNESNLQNYNESTPSTKANLFVDEVLPSTSEEDKQKIKKKIFELNVLSDSLKTVYSKTNTNKDKKTLKKIVDNEITNRYRIKNKLSAKLGIKRIRKGQIANKLRITNVHAEEIKLFFCRDDISRATAGKQETKTKNKNKKQKRYLLDSMIDLHSKYRQEGGKLSYATFVRLKPFYVLRPNVNNRNTCACNKHSNMLFKARKLKSLNLLETDNLSELVKKIVCDINSQDCMYSKCSLCKNKSIEIDLNSENENIQISWNEWKLKKHTYTKHTKEGPKEKTVMKTTNELITGSVKQLVSKFKQDLQLFKKHTFNIFHQYNEYKKCIDNLQSDEISILCDFSENYTCKLSEQVQSAHFGSSQNQFTLHTGVLYMKDVQPMSFCTISPSKAHDPGAIWAHLSPIIEYAKSVCPSIRVIHFFSDGPATQYRQKKNFFLLSKIIGESIFEYATWNFFEASHGKGPADGVGGAIKRKLDQLVAYGNDVSDSKVAYDLLKSCQSKVKIFYITEESIGTFQDLIPLNLVALAGTLNTHQIITKAEYASVYSRELSCFCGVATKKGLCKCYDIRSHNLIENKKSTRTQKRKPKGTETKKLNKKRKKRAELESSESEVESDITYMESDLDASLDFDEAKNTSDEQLLHEEFNIEKEKKEPKNNEGSLDASLDFDEAKNTSDEQLLHEEFKDIEKEKKEPKNNEASLSSIKILKSNKVEVILDESTGKFIVQLSSNDKSTRHYEQQMKEHESHELEQYPSTSSSCKLVNNEIETASDVKYNKRLRPGDFVLVKFPSHRNREFRFVCRIEELNAEFNKLVVQGFKSKKKKNIYGAIKNDISIIDNEDIIEHLDKPKIEGNSYIFSTNINVKEI